MRLLSSPSPSTSRSFPSLWRIEGRRRQRFDQGDGFLGDDRSCRWRSGESRSLEGEKGEDHHHIQEAAHEEDAPPSLLRLAHTEQEEKVTLRVRAEFPPVVTRAAPEPLPERFFFDAKEGLEKARGIFSNLSPTPSDRSEESDP
jgi:hypothetical protein